jgi:hypothetical protein
MMIAMVTPGGVMFKAYTVLQFKKHGHGSIFPTPSLYFWHAVK